MAPSSSSSSGSGSISSSQSNILALNFNQDASCVAVGTRQGYRIINCEPFGKVFSKDDGPVSIVEMLFCTSLVALVGTPDSNSNASPRRLQIVNTKRQSTICELLFPTTILGVKLNRRRLVVVLEEEIYIYDISNMKLLHTIETSPNPQAICALTSSSDPCYLAYPSPVPSPSSPFSSTNSSPGDVLIFDLLTLSVVNIIQAHKTPISALALNPTGSLLATASDKGTIIRVFSIPNAVKKAQFRRGVSPTKIFSLSFNAVSSLLSVSSQTGTVHIFKLDENGMAGNNSNGGKKDKRKLLSSNVDDESENGSENGGFNNGNAGGGGYEAFIDDRKKSGGLSGTLRRSSQAFSRSVGGSVGGYLPNSLAEMWEPSRDFAFLKLPNGGVGSMVAVSSTTPQVMVVTSEGYLYCYNIDLEQGGECVLMKQHSLLDGADTSNGGSSSLAE